jgi:hypothetical protein
VFTAGGGGSCQADSSALTTGDAPGLGLDANVLRADTAPPASADPALYRATVKVKRSSTFTLPRAVSP